MRLTTAIMCHPDRYDMASTLKERLPKLDAEIFNDENLDGIWVNAKRAWQSGIQTTYLIHDHWHMVLQEDIEICRNFEATIKHIVERFWLAKINAPIILCSSSPAMKRSIASRRSYMKAYFVSNAQAIIMPSVMIRDWLQWEEQNIDQDYIPDDGRLEAWLKTKKIAAYYTVPSIVDHIGDESKRLGSTNSYRAYRFHSGSGLTINWNLTEENIYKDWNAMLRDDQKAAMGIMPKEHVALNKTLFYSTKTI